MNKKKILIFGIPLFVVILVGVFFLLDKYFLHIVIKSKPGSCLVLEEKYCKTGELVYYDNTPVSIKYKTNKGAKLFSPTSNVFYISNGKKDDGTKLKILVIGKQNEVGNIYQIVFSGDVSTTDYDGSKLDNIIQKGDLLGTTSGTEVLLILEKVSLDDFQNITINNDGEELKNFFEKTKQNG